VSQCPNNTYLQKYVDGGVSCSSCSDKLNEILGMGGCVCKSQYTMVNGTCVKMVEAGGRNVTGSGSGVNSSGLQSLLQLFEQMQTKMGVSGSNISNSESNTISKSSSQSCSINQSSSTSTLVSSSNSSI
jgi:hypothetical protein